MFFAEVISVKNDFIDFLDYLRERPDDTQVDYERLIVLSDDSTENIMKYVDNVANETINLSFRQSLMLLRSYHEWLESIGAFDHDRNE